MAVDELSIVISADAAPALSAISEVQAALQRLGELRTQNLSTAFTTLADAVQTIAKSTEGLDRLAAVSERLQALGETAGAAQAIADIGQALSDLARAGDVAGTVERLLGVLREAAGTAADFAGLAQMATSVQALGDAIARVAAAAAELRGGLSETGAASTTAAADALAHEAEQAHQAAEAQQQRAAAEQRAEAAASQQAAATERAAQTTAQLTQAATAASEAQSRNVSAAEAMAGALRAVDDVTGPLTGLLRALGDGLGAVSERALGAAEALGETLRASISRLSDVIGSARAVAGGASLIGGLVSTMAGGLASDFQSELARIQSFALGAGQSISDVRDQLLDLSTRVPESLTSLADGMYHVLSAGVTTAQATDGAFKGMAASEAVLMVAAQAAVAAHSNLTDTLNALTEALNSYHVNMNDANEVTNQAVHYMDVLSRTAQLGNIDLGDLVTQMGRMAPQASELGLSIEEVGANIALLTRINGNAAQSATEFSAVLTQFTRDTKTTESALNSIGLTGKQVIEVIRDQGLVAAFQLIEQAARNAGKSGADLDMLLTHIFPNIRAFRDYVGIFSQSRQEPFDAYQEMLGKMQNAAGTFANAWEITRVTFSVTLRQLANDVRTIMTEVGAGIIGPLQGPLQALNGMLQTLATTLRTDPGFAAAAGHVLGLATAVTFLIGGVTVLDNALLFVGGALGPFVFGIRELAGSISTVLEPLTMLALAALALRTAWETNFLGMRDALQQAGITPVLHELNTALQDLGNAVHDALGGNLRQALDDASEAVRRFWQTLTGQDTVSFLGNLGDRVGGLAGQLVNALGQAIQQAVERLPQLLERLPQLLETIGDRLGPVADRIASALGSALGHALDGMIGLLHDEGGRILQALGDGIAGAVNIIVPGAIDLGKRIIGAILDGLRSQSGTIIDTLGNLISGGLSGILHIADALGEHLAPVIGILTTLAGTFALVGQQSAIFFARNQVAKAATEEAAQAATQLAAAVDAVGVKAVLGATSLAGIAASVLALEGNARAATAVLETLGAAFLGMKVGAIVQEWVGAIAAFVQSVGTLRQAIADGSLAAATLSGLASSLGGMWVLAGGAIAAAGAALFILNDRFGIFDSTLDRVSKSTEKMTASWVQAQEALGKSTPDIVGDMLPQLDALAQKLDEDKAKVEELQQQHMSMQPGSVEQIQFWTQTLSQAEDEVEKDVGKIQGTIKGLADAHVPIQQLMDALVQLHVPLDQLPQPVQQAIEKVYHLSEANLQAQYSAAQMRAEVAADIQAFKDLSTATAQASNDVVRNIDATAKAAEALGISVRDAALQYSSTDLAPLMAMVRQYSQLWDEIQSQNLKGIDTKDLTQQATAAGRAVMDAIGRAVQEYKAQGLGEDTIRSIFDGLVKQIQDPRIQNEVRAAINQAMDQAFADAHKEKQIAATFNIAVDESSTEAAKSAVQGVDERVKQLEMDANQARDALLRMFSDPAQDQNQADLDLAIAKRDQDIIKGASKEQIQQDDEEVQSKQKLTHAAQEYAQVVSKEVDAQARLGKTWEETNQYLQQHGVNLAEIDASYPGFINHIQRVYDTSHNLYVMTDGLKNTFGDLAGPIGQFFQELKAGVAPQTAFNDLVVRTNGAIYGQIGALQQYQPEALKAAGVTDQTAQAAQQLVGAIASGEQPLTTFGHGLKGVADGSGQVQVSAQAASVEAERMGHTVTKAADDITAHMGGMAEQITTQTTQAATQAEQGVGQAMSGVTAKVAQTATDVATQAGHIGQGIVQGVETGLTAGNQAVDFGISNITTKVAQGATDVTAHMGGMAEQITLKMQDAAASGTQAVDDLFTKMQTSIASKAPQLGTDLVTGLTTGINSSAGAAQTTAQQLADATIQALGAGLGVASPSVKARAQGVDVVAGLAEGLNQVDPATAAAGNLAQAILTVLETMASTLHQAAYTAGTMASQGLAEGISAGIPAAEAAAAHLAEVAAQATAAKLQIQSPSRVYNLIGNEALRGFLQAFSDGLPDVEEAASSLGDAAATALDQALGAGKPEASPGYRAIRAVGESAQAAAPAAATQVADALSKIASAYQSGMQALATILQTALPPDLADVVAQATDALTTLWQAFSDAFGGLGATTADTVGKIADDVTKVIAPFKAVADVAQSLAQVTGGIDPDRLQQLADVTLQLSDQLLGFFETLDQQAASRGGAVAAEAQKAIEVLKAAIDVFKGLQDLAGMPSDTELQALTTAVASLVDAWQQAADTLDAQGVSAAGRLATAAQSSLNMLKAALDIFKEMDDVGTAPSTTDLEWLTFKVTTLVDLWQRWATTLDEQGVAAASRLATAAQNSLTMLKAGVDVLKATMEIGDLPPVEDLQWLAVDIAALVQAWQQASTTLDEQGVATASRFSTAAQHVLTMLKDGLDVVKGMASADFIVPTQQAIQDFATSVVQLVGALGDALESAGLSQAIASATGAVSKAMGDALSGLKSGLDVLKDLSTLAVPSRTQIDAFVRAAIEMFNELEAQAPQINAAAERATTALGNAMKSGFDGLSGALGVFKNLWDLIKPSTSLTPQGTPDLHVLARLIDGMINDLVPIIQHIATLTISPELAEQAQRIAGTIQRVFGAIGTALQTISTVKNDFAPNAQGQGGAAAQLATFYTLIGQIAEFAKDRLVPVGQQFADAAQQFGQDVQKGVQAIAGAIQQLAGLGILGGSGAGGGGGAGTGAPFLPAAQNLQAAGAQAADSMLTGMQTTVANQAPDVGRKLVSGFSSGITGDANEARASAQTLAQQTAQALDQGLQQQTGAVRGAAADLVQQILDELSAERDTLYQAAYQDGESVGQGLANGILATVGLAVQAVTTMANGVMTQARTLLGVHSPSSVFMEMGDNVVQGLVQGMAGGMADVQAAASGLAQAAVGAFQQTLNDSGGGGGGQPSGWQPPTPWEQKYYGRGDGTYDPPDSIVPGPMSDQEALRILLDPHASQYAKEMANAGVQIQRQIEENARLQALYENFMAMNYWTAHYAGWAYAIGMDVDQIMQQARLLGVSKGEALQIAQAYQQGQYWSLQDALNDLSKRAAQLTSALAPAAQTASTATGQGMFNLGKGVFDAWDALVAVMETAASKQNVPVGGSDYGTRMSSPWMPAPTIQVSVTVQGTGLLSPSDANALASALTPALARSLQASFTTTPGGL